MADPSAAVPPTLLASDSAGQTEARSRQVDSDLTALGLIVEFLDSRLTAVEAELTP